MSKSIRLHPTRGLNPKLVVCYFCHREKNELVLLGNVASSNREVQDSKYLVVDKKPCEWCRENMAKGIVLVETSKDSTGEIVIRGGYAVVTEKFIRRTLNEAVVEGMLKHRLAFIESDAWVRLGLDDHELPTCPL